MKQFIVIFLILLTSLNSVIASGGEVDRRVRNLVSNLETLRNGPSAHDCDRTIEATEVDDKEGNKIPVSAVSLDYLQEIFGVLQSRDDIPFGYPEDGCYARAHKMSMLMDEMGVTSVKTFIEGDLRVETKNSPKGFVEWWYHVAPMVMVKKPNGEMVPYIIDPSIFDHPVPAQEWFDIQTRHNPTEDKTTYNTVRYVYQPIGQTNRTEYSQDDTLDMEDTMSRYRSIQDLRRETRSEEN